MLRVSAKAVMTGLDRLSIPAGRAMSACMTPCCATLIYNVVLAGRCAGDRQSFQGPDYTHSWHAVTWRALLAQHNLASVRVMAVDMTPAIDTSPRSLAMQMIRNRHAAPAQQLHYLRVQSNLPDVGMLPRTPQLVRLTGTAVTSISEAVKEAAGALRVLDLSGSNITSIATMFSSLRMLQHLIRS